MPKVSEIKECMKLWLEHGIDFWYNGYWASQFRGGNPLTQWRDTGRYIRLRQSTGTWIARTKSYDWIAHI